MDHAQKLELFKEVMDGVYGEYTDESWKPKHYADNKGRYLWTDAFGVCNYLTLYCETNEAKYLHQAERLVEDVHNTLGKNRAQTTRLGNSTEQHPLNGGLRIGKVHAEGHPDGDGQYFHYLTKWAFALNRMSLVKRECKYNDWAIELIKAIHPYFVFNRNTDRPRMVWKTTIDLSAPAVPSEGNLDPFDGYVTYRIVASHSTSGVLAQEILDMEKMVFNKYNRYSSDDPLDLGEALWITHNFPSEKWSKKVSSVSLLSLEYLWKEGYFSMPTSMRLAFREFGTTIGVQVHPDASAEWKQNRVSKLHEMWKPKLLKRDNDITPTMFCASLIPGVWCATYDKLFANNWETKSR